MSKDVLVLSVLDELAEGYGYKKWEEITIPMLKFEISKSDFERAVVLGFVAGRKTEKERILKEINEEIVLHLNNAEATNEPCCNCMVEGEGDCETMEVLKGLRKRFVGGKKNE